MIKNRLFSVIAIIALFAATVIPVSAAFPYLGSGDYFPYVFQPSDGTWGNDQITGYFEAQTSAMAVLVKNVIPEAEKTGRVLFLCLEERSQASKDYFALVDFDRWDTTYATSQMWPNASGQGRFPMGETIEGVTYNTVGSPEILGLLGEYNLKITDVQGPSSTIAECTPGYFGVKVTFDIDKVAENAYITYGGIISYPGATSFINSEPVTETTSARNVPGGFQTRVASSGDKTINYKTPGALQMTDVAVNKACELFTYPGQRYRITVTNAGPGLAIGATLVDTLPAGVSLTSWTSMRTLGGVSASMGTCSSVGQTVTCVLGGSLASTASDPTARWVVDLMFAGDPGRVLNTVDVTTITVDTSTDNNYDETICTVPSAVGLVSFTATGGASSIELAWETASELDNVGFNLYRAESAGNTAKMVKLNDGLIASSALGSLAGASYSFTDSAVAAGVAYYYWLEDVNSAGATALTGPVSASLVAGTESAAPALVVPTKPLVRDLPVLVAPVIEPVLLGPVDQLPVIVDPFNPAPVAVPSPILSGPIVGPALPSLPVETGQS